MLRKVLGRARVLSDPLSSGDVGILPGGHPEAQKNQRKLIMLIIPHCSHHVLDSQGLAQGGSDCCCGLAPACSTSKGSRKVKMTKRVVKKGIKSAGVAQRVHGGKPLAT